MDTSPTVSVIIPTYNRAAYIGAAIQSVLDQTYTDYEIIVVDDGSTDNTDEIVAQFGDAVRYFKQANAGSSSARNHGLREALGQFIAFLDSDDIFLPTKLEKQIAYFQAHPAAGMVHNPYIDMTHDGEFIREVRTDQYQGQAYKQLLYGCPIVTPSVMLRRETVDQVGEFDPDLPMSQDIDYWIRVARQYEIGALAEPLTKVRRHTGNKPLNFEKILTYAIYILDKNRALSPELSGIFWRKMYAHKYYFIGHKFLNQQTPDARNAWRCWRQGFAQWPFSGEGVLLAARLLSRTLLPESLKNRVRKWLRR